MNFLMDLKPKSARLREREREINCGIVKKERREIITQFERQWQRQLFKFASLTHFTILNFSKQGWKHTQMKYLKQKLKNPIICKKEFSFV